MNSKQKRQMLLDFDAIGVFDSAIIDKSTCRSELEKVIDCFDRFLNYDFGDLDPEQMAQNNSSILTGNDNLFGSYDIGSGQLHIALYEGKYRFLFDSK